MKDIIAKAELKRVVDGVLSHGGTKVESSLEPGEYYIYTESWFITAQQLKSICSAVNITAISVDGGTLMLTAKYNP